MRSSAPPGSVPPARAVNDVAPPRPDVEDNRRTAVPWQLVRARLAAWGACRDSTIIVDRAEVFCLRLPVGIVCLQRRVGAWARAERNGPCNRHGCRDSDSCASVAHCHRANSRTQSQRDPSPIFADACGKTRPNAGANLHSVAPRHCAAVHSDPEARRHFGIGQRVA